MREFNTAVVRVKDDSGGYKSLSALRGESSYAIAVQNGFEGTEEEWMESIIGDGWIGAFQDLEVQVNNAQAAADKAQETADNNQLIIEKEVTTLITRSRLAKDALYSPIKYANEDRLITDADLGYTLMSTSRVTLTVSAGDLIALPNGSEIAICSWTTNGMYVKFTGTTVPCHVDEGRLRTADDADVTIKIPCYGMIALKKMSSTSYLVTGNVEVV